jgi:hypothetical protein
MSNIDKYTNFISEQVRKESNVGLRSGIVKEQVRENGGLVTEAANTPAYHKQQFEKHAKLVRGHQAALNSEDNVGPYADNDGVYDRFFDHHEDLHKEHRAKAQEHANAYHKLTGQKLNHPPIDNRHKYEGYKNVNKPKAGSAPHDNDEEYLPMHLKTDAHKLDRYGTMVPD